MPELRPETIVEQPLVPFENPSPAAKIESELEKIESESVMIPPQQMDEDIITLSIRDDELPDAVLKAVLLGLAEEQQALKEVRTNKQKNDKDNNRVSDVSNISLKRGTLLKYMSETLIQRQALVGGAGEIDLKGPKFREVMKMFLNIVADTFTQIKIPSEYRDLFFQSLARNMEGWETKAEKILRTIR
jgi:hypothetical protein